MRSCLDDKLRQRGWRLLSKICKARSILPTSYLLQQELIRAGKVLCHGGFADVSDGEYSGRLIAIKRLRTNEGDSDRVFEVPLLNPVHYLCSDLTQRLCREIIAWKHLSHRNILPLFGISVSTDPRGFCILTEWMPNGNVIQYAKSNPEADRFRLVSPLAVSP